MRIVGTAVWAVCALTVLSGCSESVLIRSNPPDAEVFIDGEPRGTTPIVYVVERDQLKEQTLLLRKRNYQPMEDRIQLRLARGRVVGAVFTLGLLYAFRSPYYLAVDEQGYRLWPDPAALAAAQQAERDRIVGLEVRQINEQHQRGEISEAERDALLRKLLHPAQP